MIKDNMFNIKVKTEFLSKYYEILSQNFDLTKSNDELVKTD